MNVMLTKKGANNTLVKRIGGLALGLLVIFLLSIKGVAIYNVALYLLLISLCIYSWKMRQLPKLPSGNIFFAYVFFCICLVLAGFLQGDMDSVKGGVGYVYRTLPFLLLYIGVSCFDKKDIVYKGILAALCVNACTVLYWYLQVWDRHSRLDIVDGPNLTIEILSLSFIFGLLAVYKYRRNKLVLVIGVVSSLMLLLGMWWTASRGGMMGLLVGAAVTFFYYLFAKKRERFKSPVVVSAFLMIVGALTVCSLTAYLFPRSSSDTERLCIYKSAVQMFIDHPVAGVGFYNFSKDYVNYVQPEEPSGIVFQHAHNDFLQFLSTTGGVGTIGFVFFSFVFLLELLRRVIYRPQEPIYLAMLCAFITMYMHGLVDTAMCYNTGTRMVFGLLGMVFAIGDRREA